MPDTDTANPVRGEVDLELEGVRYVLRPSYQAIVKIETQTGLTMLELAMQAEVNAMKTEHVAIAVTEMVRAWGHTVEASDYMPAAEKAALSTARFVGTEAMGELIYSIGVLAVQPRLALALGRAVSGGCLPSGEAKPVGETTPETPAAD